MPSLNVTHGATESTDCSPDHQATASSQKLMSCCGCWKYPGQETVKRVMLVCLLLLSHIAEAKVNKYPGRPSPVTVIDTNTELTILQSIHDPQCGSKS